MSFALLVAAWSAGAARAADQAPVLTVAVDTLTEQVSTLRGLPFLFVPPVEVESPEDVRRHTLEGLRKDEARGEVAELDATLRAFHQLRGRADLETLFVDVLTEQVGGYYDPDTQRLVAVQSTTPTAGHFETLVVAHELVHALQDQHFDLWRLGHRDHRSTDVQTATAALIEGDASFAMARYALGTMASDVDAMTEASFREAFVKGHLERAFDGPTDQLPALARNAIFSPYVHGLAFARAVHRARGWTGLDAAFANPPLSTEQILHPERYLEGDDPPLWPDLPDLRRRFGVGFELEVDDALGELGIRSLLATRGIGQVTDKRFPAADGWGGDRYHVYKGPTGLRSVVWRTLWDSERDALEFADAVVALSMPPGRKRVPKRLSRRTRVGTWTVLQQGVEVIVFVDVNALLAPFLRLAMVDLGVTTIEHLDQISPPREEARQQAMPSRPMESE